MSRRNGDRSRFHVDRKRKMLHRQRIQELLKAHRPLPPVTSPPAEPVSGTADISNLTSDQP